MKNLYLLLFCSLLFAATTVSAQTWSCGATETDDVHATLSAGTLTISGTGDMANFLVTSDPPASDVPWWDERASITEVIVADDITSVGNYAFRDCPNLSSVTIAGSVTRIGYGAFIDCTGLTSLTIPGSVETIDEIAFRGCTGLTSVTVEWDTPLSIPADVFENCETNLVWLIVPEGRETAYATASVWEDFYIEGTASLQNSGSCGDNLTWEYDMNGTLTISGYGLMTNYDNDTPAPWDVFGGKIYALELPDGLTSIGQYAFNYCTRLTSVTIPDGVTHIFQNAFSYCSDLTSVTIPGSVASIDASAFRRCAGLTSVTIPGQVTYIGDEAFYNCTGLASVTVEWDTPLSISANVFSGLTTSGITLIVPTGTSAAYLADPVWGDFDIHELVVITGVSIKTQPTLVYTENETLDLSDLEVTLTYSDETSADVVFDNFAEYGLTVSLANGAILTLDDDGVAITVTHTESEEFATTDNLTINPATVTVTGIAIKTQPTLMYTEGEALDLSDLEVTLTYSDETTEDVAFENFAEYGLTVSPEDDTILTLDDDGTVVTVTHTESEKFATTDNLTVNPVTVTVTVTEIAIKTQPTLMYTEGDALDLSDLEVTLTYSDETTEDVAFENFAEYGLTVSPEDDTILTLDDDGTVVTVTHTESEEFATTEYLTVNEAPPAPTVTGIEIKTQPTLVYTEGEALDLTDLEVTLTYSDETTKDVVFADFGTNGLTVSLANGAILTLGDDGATLTVTHTDIEEPVTIGELTVNEAPTVTEIAIKTQPTLVYTEGKALDLSDLEVTLTYSDETTVDVAFEDFEEYGLTVSLANGAILTLDDDGAVVTVTHTESGKYADTDDLTVNEAPTVTGVAIKTQPTLVYTEGDALDLSDLEVTLMYSDETTEDVAFEDFEEYGLTVSPEDGAILTLDDDGTVVTVAHTESEESATTDELTVTVATIPVTGVSLNKTTLSLTVGGSEKLIPTVTPNNATNPAVTWTSSSNAAKVSDDGTVTAEAPGNATITVKTTDGNFTATCAVTVTQVTSAEIIDQPLAKMYPNPTNGLFTLQFEIPGTYSVTITTVSGTTLLRQTVGDQIKQMDISNYPAGVYLLLVNDGKRQSVTKIVKN